MLKCTTEVSRLKAIMARAPVERGTGGGWSKGREMCVRFKTSFNDHMYDKALSTATRSLRS